VIILFSSILISLILVQLIRYSGSTFLVDVPELISRSSCRADLTSDNEKDLEADNDNKDGNGNNDDDNNNDDGDVVNHPFDDKEGLVVINVEPEEQRDSEGDDGSPFFVDDAAAPSHDQHAS
jgi:hypothetical protein